MTQINKSEDLNGQFASLETGMTQRYKFRDRWCTLLYFYCVNCKYSSKRCCSYGIQVIMVLWQENVPIDTDEGQIICNLIAVHAGLERTIDLNEQLRVLRTRDTRVPKVQMLSGRQDVWDTPKVKKKSASYFSLVYQKRNLFWVFNIYQLGETTYSAEWFCKCLFLYHEF